MSGTLETQMGSARGQLPSLSSVQTVAAVERTFWPWSQRAGDVLVARVQTDTSDQRPFGLIAWDLETRQLMWMNGSPPPCLPVSPYIRQTLDGELVFWGWGDSRLGLYLADLRTGHTRPVAADVAAKMEKETAQITTMWTAPLTGPATDGHHLIFLGSPTHARAVSASSGRLVWEVSLPWPPGPASCRPYLSSETTEVVHFYSELGRVIALWASDGEVLWHRDLLRIEAAPNEPLGEPVEHFAIANMVEVGAGRLFFATGSEVYALDADSGRTLWKAELAGASVPAPYQPLLWGRMLVVVVPGMPDQLKALDAKTGEVLWTWKLGQIAKEVSDPGWVPPSKPLPGWNHVSSNLLVAGDEVLFCTVDGMLRALGHDRRGEHWQVRLAPQSSPYADFAATLHLVGSQVVAFDGTTAWWIDIPSTADATHSLDRCAPGGR